MGSIVEYLKGKKTNLLGVGIGIVVVLFATGVINKEISEMLLGLLGGGAVLSIGAKIDRGAKAVVAGEG